MTTMASENAPEPEYTLYVYYTRYSSWGVRAQLILEYFAIPYKVEYFNYTIPSLTPPADLRVLPVLDVTPAPTGAATITASSSTTPSASGGEATLRIPDSLAIAEYLASEHPSLPLWPADPQLRALARVAACTMHSGFLTLRNTYSTNFLARFSGSGLKTLYNNTEGVTSELAQLFALWERTRVATVRRLGELGVADEGFLCGGFSIADAFFWPVLWRLRSYDLPLTGLTDEGRRWMATMWNDPVMKAQAKEYFRQARDPKSCFKSYDDMFEGNPDISYGTFSEDWVFDGPGV
ncbi:putative glutathione S transferase [Xylaria arbuscula]|nr:putative glutathione S transferase [Xylaria arbuscula]